MQAVPLSKTELRILELIRKAQRSSDASGKPRELLLKFNRKAPICILRTEVLKIDNATALA